MSDPRGTRPRPPTAVSIIGAAIGSAMIVAGVSFMIPKYGLFGYLWTAVAVTVAAIHVFNLLAP